MEVSVELFLEFVRENAFIIAIAASGIFGCMAFGLAGKGLSRLYEDTQSMATTANPFLKQLKLRRENGMRINTGVHNSYAFVVKNMDKFKYLNMTVADYMRMAGLLQLVSLMLGLIAGVTGSNVWYTAYGCVCAMAVAGVGKMENLDRRELQVIASMVDYFDNVTTSTQEDKDEEDNLGTDRTMAELKADAASLDEAKKVQLNITEEQRRVIEEVLKEYLA